MLSVDLRLRYIYTLGFLFSGSILTLSSSSACDLAFKFHSMQSDHSGRVMTSCVVFKRRLRRRKLTFGLQFYDVTR